MPYNFNSFLPLQFALKFNSFHIYGVFSFSNHSISPFSQAVSVAASSRACAGLAIHFFCAKERWLVWPYGRQYLHMVTKFCYLAIEEVPFVLSLIGSDQDVLPVSVVWYFCASKYQFILESLICIKLLLQFKTLVMSLVWQDDIRTCILLAHISLLFHFIF